jgi:AraC-like DNA-binding protein
MEVAVVYLERAPAAPLAPFVRMLWCARHQAASHHRERVLPTGCVQIILNLARDYVLGCREGAPDVLRPASLVVGARSVYDIVDSSDMADLVGIVFSPGGFPPFASDAADRFSNQSVALEDVWGAGARSVRDQLRDRSAPEARLGLLEQFLVARFAPRLARGPRSPQVLSALRWLAHNPGAARVAETARRIGWSERRFSQVFREEVGLTPKVWCRIRRFQSAVRQLHAGVRIPWAELALDCGYYDQSHFANDFRAFSGVDATTYSARRTLWANHVRAD